MRSLDQRGSSQVSQILKSSWDLPAWRLTELEEKLVDQLTDHLRSDLDWPASAAHLLQDVLRAVDRAGLCLVPRPE